MYNAAELSALASSRPYAQSVRESIPASLEGGSSSAAQLPLVGGSIQGGGYSGTTNLTASRVGKDALAAAAGGAAASGGGAVAATGGGSTGGAGAAAEPAAGLLAMVGGEAKIVHGQLGVSRRMQRRLNAQFGGEDDPPAAAAVERWVARARGGQSRYPPLMVPKRLGDTYRYCAWYCAQTPLDVAVPRS
jgi:hypothetical protein